MRNIIILLVWMSIFITQAFGQTASVADTDVWKALSSVTYEVTEDEYGELYVPEFSKQAQQLEGQVVTVKGYMVPFDGLFKPTHVIISSLPLASCFFCGAGGPETVMEVYLQDPVKYTESLVAFQGKLKLNAQNYEQLMYILEDATFVGEVDH